MKIQAFILIFLLISSQIVSASLPRDAGLFLSFEQKLIATYALASNGKSDKKKAALFSKVQTSIESLSTWALDQGLKMPTEFINLNRGIAIVN
jgi:hypothetical protein